jgi:hypothetical protein
MIIIEITLMSIIIHETARRELYPEKISVFEFGARGLEDLEDQIII